MMLWTFVFIFWACLVAILLGSVWSMNVYLKRSIGSKHRLIQEISESGRVPEAWSRKFESKAAGRKGKQRSPEALAVIRSRKERYYAKQVSRLIRYVRTTRLVPEEETRAMLIDDLNRIRGQWEVRRRHEGSV